MSRWILSVALLLSAGHIRAQDARFESAVACIKRYEGMHDHRHLPYVGYGHKLLPGESFPTMTEKLADSLLRADLRKKCAVFRRFGADSLLCKLEAGERDIHSEYAAFCHYKGKAVPSIRRRREEEFKILFIK